MPTYAIGVDLGGTHVRGVRLDERGDVLVNVREQTAARAGPAAVVDQLCRLIDSVSADVPPPSIAGIGVCVAGPVDPDEGIVLEASTMSGWHNVPLRDLLAQRTGLRVMLANDGNAAAVGEWRRGSGQGCRHFVYVTVSTGIGGGLSNALDLFLPQIKHEIRTRAMPPFRGVPVMQAALGDNAGVIRAGALVFEGS